jgi:hypothetical protein
MSYGAYQLCGRNQSGQSHVHVTAVLHPTTEKFTVIFQLMSRKIEFFRISGQKLG